MIFPHHLGARTMPRVTIPHENTYEWLNQMVATSGAVATWRVSEVPERNVYLKELQTIRIHFPGDDLWLDVRVNNIDHGKYHAVIQVTRRGKQTYTIEEREEDVSGQPD